MAVRAVLESFGLEGTPVATGSKGFHIWTRLDGTLGFDQVSLAARSVAGLAATHAPKAMTTEFLKKERKGRVFVDWLRATPTATVVVPFSLRPRPGAPVTVPLTWEELATAEPDGWRIGHLDDRGVDLLRTAAGPTASGHALPVGAIEAEARAAGVDLDTPHDRFGRKRGG